MPAGAPSKYRAEYCDKVIKHMSSGLSFESFAGEVDVCIATLYVWEKDHPEFLEAKNRAFAKNLTWWERQAHEGLWGERDGRVFNTTNFIFQMKNRHGWRDRKDVDIKKTLDEEEREKIKSMSMAELTRLVKESLPREKE